MRKIIWNKEAKSDYFENIDYLLKNWSEKEVQKFIDEVRHIEVVLKKGNVDFQEIGYRRVKRVVLRKQITLFYKINNMAEVEFLRFWNNHKDIKRLRF
jgi:plasmid stabilization system protein ParE